MTKIYRTSDNNYVALVSHTNDLENVEEDKTYYGVFEYSVAQNPDTGEWSLGIFDLAEEEILEVSDLEGVNSDVVHDLLSAVMGVKDYEDIVGSDYYDRGAAYDMVLDDPVLYAGVGAYYLETEEI